MTLREYIAEMVGSYESTAKEFVTTAPENSLEDRVPHVGNMETVLWVLFKEPVHVWTKDYAYKFSLRQVPETGRPEMRITQVPRSPTGEVTAGTI